MSAWVCAGFERAIWMRYWMLTSSDPRKPGETQNFVPEDFPENFSHKENLVSFLAQLSEKSKLQVIGELDELAKIFQSVKTEIMNLSKNQINT